ncbi:MAG: hypothetical protein ACTMIA_02490 [Vibrio sp.]
MFTIFSRSVGKVTAVDSSHPVIELGLRVHHSLYSQLAVGAVVIIDGVKASIYQLEEHVVYCRLRDRALLSTLSTVAVDSLVNVVFVGRTDTDDECRAITGQIDFQSCIQSVVRAEDKLRVELSLPSSNHWLKSLVPDAYLAVNGMKGVVEQVDDFAELMTVTIDATPTNTQIMDMKFGGDAVNIEVERLTTKALQAVDDGLNQALGELYPMFHQLLKLQGTTLENLAYRARAKLHQNRDESKVKEKIITRELLEDVEDAC